MLKLSHAPLAVDKLGASWPTASCSRHRPRPVLSVMATVHPSRMNLVPQDNKNTYTNGRARARTPSPRRTSRRSRSRSPDRDRGYTRDSRGGPSGRDSRHRQEDGDRSRKQRVRADDFFGEDKDGDRGRSRDRSVDREKDKEREERRDRPRRPSPEYTEYRRPSPPHTREGSAPAPWRQPENMYPGRRGGNNSYGGGGGGADFMDRYAPELSVIIVINN